MKKRFDNADKGEPRQVADDRDIRGRKPFDDADDMEFDDLLSNRQGMKPLVREPDIDSKRQTVTPAMAKRRRFLKRIVIILLGLVGTLAIASFIFWQWLISGAETGLTAPSQSTVGTSSDPVSTTEVIESSEDLIEETTEGTIADRPTIPKNTDYLSGIDYDKNLTNILIIGTDSRDASGLTFERSDTMMLLTIDKENDEIKLTSFQRDILVYLPGQSIPVKLNEANLYGPDFLVQTLNQNFLLDIEDYVMVNIMDAENLVDAIGGLEIYVEDDPDVLAYLNACIIEQNVMYEGWDDRVNWVDTIDKGGLLHLNGRQTIAYARMRKLDSDYQRMSRQREILVKSYEKMKTANVFQLIRLAKAGFDMIATNYTQTELTGMIASLLPAMSADVEQLQIPINGTYWSDNSGTWVNRVNFNMTIPALHEFIYNVKLTSFIPVPLVPYTPMEYVSMQYIEMPWTVLSGQFRGISYVGKNGWSGDGQAVDVSDGSVQLPYITPEPSSAASYPMPTGTAVSESASSSLDRDPSISESTSAAVTQNTAIPTPLPTTQASTTAATTAKPKPTVAATTVPKPTVASTPVPTPTATPLPTATPVPTLTPVPTATSIPTAPPAPEALVPDADIDNIEPAE